VLIFESALVLCAQFHHSSLKVPGWFEAIFWILFVSPSIHRIHHSVIVKERNTKYGATFSTWDRWLGTLLTDVDQDRLRIGVGAYQKPDKLNFHHLLAMPFAHPISRLVLEFVFFLAENIFVPRKLRENQNVKFEIRISKSETMTKFSKFK